MTLDHKPNDSQVAAVHHLHEGVVWPLVVSGAVGGTEESVGGGQLRRMGCGNGNTWESMWFQRTQGVAHDETAASCHSKLRLFQVNVLECGGQ
eukprot:CAMPEP_0174315512 /NCGR_PEP_ID=MMETSP0810-20121108/6334_1 /TAXON_ID=73025 ORGANISM="Eutreptiella gymnastica-like, Strain CCMP1594" /NCGR_SAMPLE_ID=MMETSP0810 /ASSEMBLY_ACC=CAM_ASM_000659 /LENGTH=92 /DNA_ID=CAMNT_0015424919 /DNA_START=2187 /DNA_END=2465 /DNA_ORIENTATION=+